MRALILASITMLAVSACHAARPTGGAPSAVPAATSAEAPAIAAGRSSDQGATRSEASRALERIGDDFWNEQLRASPTFATYLGDRSRDAELDDASEEEVARHRDALTGFLKRVEALDLAALRPDERITADVLRVELSTSLGSEVCRSWRWSVDQLGGPHVFLAELPNYHTISEPEHAQTLAIRFRSAKKLFDEQIANLRRGLSEKRVASRINVERVLKQLDEQIATPPEKSPYGRTAATLPATWTDEQRRTAETDLLGAVRDSVYPGLKAYRDVLRKEVLPRARAGVGVSELPDGTACYAARIKQYTGLESSAEELHRLGLSEVERLQGEMREIVAAKGSGPGAGAKAKVDLRAWFEARAKAKDQRLASAEALLAYNRDLVARATAALPKAFGRLPKTPIEVKAIESFREKDAPAAYYYSAPKDGSRPAYYYVNTYDPASRPLYNMAALAFHEAVPGHHFQIALANENGALPEFQRQLGQTAFVEGWALYAEGLAGELGLYRSDEERLGAMNYELWRAVRLVVDTGMHAKGWSREKALRYFLANTGHTKIEAANEIDRYILWPGQALAYKVGQLQIREMRYEAERSLGERFSLPAFHDRLLSHGGVPLSTARSDIERWIKEQRLAAR